MICLDCRANRHGRCRGGTWCDCQHRPGPAVPVPPEPADDAGGEEGEPDARPVG